MVPIIFLHVFVLKSLVGKAFYEFTEVNCLQT